MNKSDVLEIIPHETTKTTPYFDIPYSLYYMYYNAITEKNSRGIIHQKIIVQELHCGAFSDWWRFHPLTMV